MSQLDDSPDSLPNAPHPRATFDLVGLDQQQDTLLEALRSGRMHHAWLLGGPEGVGKATFAYAAARFMLTGRDPGMRAAGAASLAVSPDLPSVRRILARAHPDLHLLARAPRADGKGFTTNIPVAAVRRLLDRLVGSAGEGGWRICIIDTVDDMDRAAANALLKMLEEPPPATLFLLVSHAPGRLLPTIRSRCRLLRFGPLSETDVARAVHSALAAASVTADDESLRRAAALAEGSVRRALRFAEAGTIKLVEALLSRLDALPEVEMRALLALADDVAGKAGEAQFALLLETVQGWISERLNADAGAGVRRLAPLAEVWDKLARAARDVETFNLDRRPLVLTLFHDLSEAVSRSRAA